MDFLWRLRGGSIFVNAVLVLACRSCGHKKLSRADWEQQVFLANITLSATACRQIKADLTTDCTTINRMSRLVLVLAVLATVAVLSSSAEQGEEDRQLARQQRGAEPAAARRNNNNNSGNSRRQRKNRGRNNKQTKKSKKIKASKKIRKAKLARTQKKQKSGRRQKNVNQGRRKVVKTVARQSSNNASCLGYECLTTSIAHLKLHKTKVATYTKQFKRIVRQNKTGDGKSGEWKQLLYRSIFHNPSYFNSF